MNNKLNTTLGEITLSIFDGKHGDCEDMTGSGCYFISVKDLKEYEIDYTNAREIIPQDFQKNYTRTSLENGDTIYANTGDTIGKSLYVIGNALTDKTSFQKSVAILKPDTTFIESRYLYYLMKYETARLRRAATGSGQKNLLLSTMREFEVSIHDRDTQKKIVAVLSCIDDKIRYNNLINDNLQQQLCLIYEHMMCQFKKGKVEGRTMEASELTEIITGKEDANFSVANGKYKFFTCSNDTLQCDDYAFESSSVLIAGNGDFNVKHYSGKFNAYQRTYVLTPAKDYYGILYLASLYQIKAFKSASTGSIVKFITKGDIESIPVFLPNDNTYLKQMNHLISLQEKNSLENEELTKLRDWLLPMLMNGQATISD